MAKQDNSIKKFILEFFRESKIIEKNKVLEISSVPPEFEDFLGKKAPYKLVFDFESHNKIEDSELITKGSYFLLAIRDYLRLKGQTSLMKLDLKFVKPNLKILKLGNCKVLEAKEKPAFCYFPEFTFLSVCQYLNERSQFINKLQFKGNNLLKMDLSAIKPGNKDEVHSINVNNEYLFAKSEISKIAEEQSKEMKKNLAKKLEIELDRIKLYYSNQIREKDEEIERCTKKIKLFESELKHTFYDRDISNIKRKIREQTQILEKLKQQGYLERLKNEETFHINDEIDKHVLSLSHYLLHTMVIYYPALTLELALQGKKSSSSLKIQVTYDPLLKKFAIPACSSCSKEIDEINICQQNHLVCENCLKKCSCCGRD